MFDGDADAVIAPAFDGEVGILPHHAPFMTLLGQGILSVRSAATVTRFTVRGGFLQVVGDRVRVVAEHVQGASHAS
jgi:F-type H+-transporting ATPase subunit epsilon